MTAYSTVFHPLTLELLIIPVSIGFGLIAVWVTERILIGLFVQFILSFLFDLWFWGSFYEDGSYADNAIHIGRFINYSIVSAFTWGILWLLLYYKNYRRAMSENRRNG